MKEISSSLIDKILDCEEESMNEEYEKNIALRELSDIEINELINVIGFVKELPFIFDGFEFLHALSKRKRDSSSRSPAHTFFLDDEKIVFKYFNGILYDNYKTEDIESIVLKITIVHRSMKKVNVEISQ